MPNVVDKGSYEFETSNKKVLQKLPGGDHACIVIYILTRIQNKNFLSRCAYTYES